MWSNSLEAVDSRTLAKYFTVESPLGPLNARLVTDAKVLELLTETELVAVRNQSRRPSIVVGRRGSGKTSYLRRLGLEHHSGLFIDIKTERTFNLILGAIDSAIPQQVSVESVASMWDGVFWNCLLWLLLRAGRPQVGRVLVKEHLARIGLTECRSIEEVMGVLSASFQRLAKASGPFAVERINEYLCGSQYAHLQALATQDLASRGEAALIVLDSLDDYPIRVNDFSKGLSGLLKAAGEFNAVVRNFDIRLCLPSELYWEFAEQVSTNSTKDFSQQLLVRWQVGELLLAACKRIMVYLKLFHPRAYNVVKGNPLANRQDADRFLEAVFPKQVENLLGRREATEKYLLRHTQLLPRQLFLLLAEIFKLNSINENFEPGKTTFILEDAVRLGVRDTEDRLVSEILSAFRNRYPEAKDVCMTILPSIPKVFSFNQLSNAVRQFGEEHGKQNIPVAPIKRMLIEIGAIGKVDEVNVDYVTGKFEYVQTARLAIGADDRMCVHPLFSRIYDCKAAAKTDPPVLPLPGNL